MKQLITAILIILLIGESYGRLQRPFDSKDIRQRRADKHIHTIDQEFIVFFNETCLTEKEQYGRDATQEFLDEFQCYTKNKKKINLYRGIDTYWIVVNRIINCHADDEKEIELNNYCITEIDENEEVELDGITCSHRNVEYDVWHLNDISTEINNSVEFIQYDSSFDPLIDIIVMDTGIYAEHAEFTGITIERIFDAYPEEIELNDHGTHVSGSIVGYNYGVFRAEQTKIKLIDVRVFGSIGGTSTDVILNGYEAIIEYLQNNPRRKAIINFSFGGGNWNEKTVRIKLIRQYGGICFAAAGNGNIPASYKSPASSTDVITIGALDTDNTKAAFSNYGPSVDIWAPGVDIKSAVPNGLYDNKGGTSMATPIVAGIAANILALNSDLDFEGVKNALLNGAIYDVNDENGLTNQPRVQLSCKLYSEASNRVLSGNNELILSSPNWNIVGRGLSQISIGSDGTIYGINEKGQTFELSITDEWIQIPGRLKQIAVGNMDNVWGINVYDQPVKLENDTWIESIPFDGSMAQISVGSDETVLGIDSNGIVWRIANNVWMIQISVENGFKQISVGSANHIWGILNYYGYTNSLCRFDAINQVWNLIGGASANYIDVASNGDVWILDAANEIFRYDCSNDKWINYIGTLKQISINDGMLAGITNNNKVYITSLTNIADTIESRYDCIGNPNIVAGSEGIFKFDFMDQVSGKEKNVSNIGVMVYFNLLFCIALFIIMICCGIVIYCHINNKFNQFAIHQKEKKFQIISMESDNDISDIEDI